MVFSVSPAGVDPEALRSQIREKYQEVALEPQTGFHFHTGRPLARMLGYRSEAVDWLPDQTIDSFAGTGNPIGIAPLPYGGVVVDLGCGAGMDTLLAARAVGLRGRVIAVDMTPAMLDKARAGAAALSLQNVEVRRGSRSTCPSTMPRPTW